MCGIPGGGARPVRHTSHALPGKGPVGSRRKNEADVCVHNRTDVHNYGFILGTAQYYIILISQYFNFCTYQFLYI